MEPHPTVQQIEPHLTVQTLTLTVLSGRLTVLSGLGLLSGKLYGALSSLEIAEYCHQHIRPNPFFNMAIPLKEFKYSLKILCKSFKERFFYFTKTEIE